MSQRISASVPSRPLATATVSASLHSSRLSADPTFLLVEVGTPGRRGDCACSALFKQPYETGRGAMGLPSSPQPRLVVRTNTNGRRPYT
jgi:hypothetical protein